MHDAARLLQFTPAAHTVCSSPPNDSYTGAGRKCNRETRQMAAIILFPFSLVSCINQSAPRFFVNPPEIRVSRTHSEIVLLTSHTTLSFSDNLVIHSIFVPIHFNQPRGTRRGLVRQKGKLQKRLTGRSLRLQLPPNGSTWN